MRDGGKGVDEAKALVEWMGTQEFGQLFTENIKQLSPIPGTMPEDPLLAEFGLRFCFVFLLIAALSGPVLGETTARSPVAGQQRGLPPPCPRPAAP